MPRFVDISGPVAAAAEVKSAINADHVFDVRDYGAIGDGTNNDLSAIQDAIDAAASAGGGRVFMPPGDYYINDMITMDDNVELCGAGNCSVLKPAYPNTNTNRVIGNDWANGNNNITLRNFALDRTGSNITHGILLNGVDGLLIDGVKIFGPAGSGLNSGCIAISCIGPGALDKPRALSRNIRVVNCEFVETGNFGCQVGFVENCVMANNTAWEADREVFGVEPEFTFGPAQRAAGAPEVQTTAKNVTIANNCITGNTTIAGSETVLIFAGDTSGGSCENVSITGNSIRQLNGGNTTVDGIRVQGGIAISITGNSIYQMDGSGIRVGNSALGCSDVVVVGNTIIDCGKGTTTSGIVLVDSERCVVVGNAIKGDDHEYSIDEGGSSGNNLIAFNVTGDSNPLNTEINTVVAGNKVTDTYPTFAVGTADQFRSIVKLNAYNSSQLMFQNSDLSRWIFTVSGTESTGNAGSDLKLTGHNDDGSTLGTAVTITRSNLRVETAQSFRVGTTLDLGHASDTTLSRASAGMVSVEGNPLGTKVAVPASTGASGVVGQWAAESGWLYICVAANTWQRVAIATW